MKEFFKKKNNLVLVFFLIILTVGLFVRFYRFPERISLDSDSGRDAFVAWSGAKSLQLPLTGPFTSIAPMVTGPWFWWQLIVATIVLPSKLAPWLYIGILSTFLILVVYKIGCLLEGRTLGLLMSLVAALSPIQITYAHWLTNHSLIGFFSSLTILFFLKNIKEKPKISLSILFGLFLGMTVNMHFQTAGLIILLPLLFLSDRKNSKIILISSLIFLTTFIPLLFFELNNHWFDTRHLLDYLLVGQYQIWTSMRWLTYIFNFWPDFWSSVIGGNYFSSLFFIAATAALMGWGLLKKTLSKEMLLLGLSFLVQVFIIRYFRGEKFFSYLNFFHPYLFIFTATILSLFFKLRPKIIFGGLAIIIYLWLVLPSVGGNFFQEFEVNIRNDTRKRIGSIVNWTKGEKYSLYRCQGYDPILGKALYGFSYLEDRVDDSSKHKIGYFNGQCSLPETFETEISKLAGLRVDYEKHFPSIISDMYDLSEASTAAILNAHWIPLTAEEEYQEAARWWLTEQP